MRKSDFIKIFLIAIISFISSANLSIAQGIVDLSAENKVKVCRDVTCTNPAPEIIYFENGEDTPLIVDAEKGLSGKAWGGELGWITFNPPYGGVFFADINTGLLKGTAWSENSGAINFSVTGQKVTINPENGEWEGYAFASGPYGGWIKFNCKEDSCLKTTSYLKTKTNDIAMVSDTTEPIKTENKKEKNNLTIIPFKRSFTNLCDGVILTINISKDLFNKSFSNLFDGTKLYISLTRILMVKSFSNLASSIMQEINNINGSAFITSYNNLITFSKKTTTIKNNFFNVIGDTSSELSVYLVNHRASLLGQINGDSYTNLQKYLTATRDSLIK